MCIRDSVGAGPVDEDPVILILPEAFFRSCAILILAAVLLCLSLIHIYRPFLTSKQLRIQGRHLPVPALIIGQGVAVQGV